MGMSVRTPRDLGAAMRATRIAKDWTQGELAQRASVSRRWVCAVERGNTPGADISLVLRVLAALGTQFEITALADGSTTDLPNLDEMAL